ncbi:MAG: PA2169 family four-helix-bundle protein [Planctomycetota bacterium]|jgi:uncharacterized protein (TIGR02284 family)
MQTALHAESIQQPLIRLAELNVDSADGFEKAAALANNTSLSQLFDQYSHERREFARTLWGFLDEAPADHAVAGSAKAQLHRWWIELRDLLQGGDDHALLVEVERGEQHIEDAYSNALGEVGSGPIRNVLQQQHDHVRKAMRRVNRIKDLSEA